MHKTSTCAWKSERKRIGKRERQIDGRRTDRSIALCLYAMSCIALCWWSALMTCWCPALLCTHSDVSRSNSCFLDAQSRDSTPVVCAVFHTHVLYCTPSAVTAYQSSKNVRITSPNVQYFGINRPIDHRFVPDIVRCKYTCSKNSTKFGSVYSQSAWCRCTKWYVTNKPIRPN